MTVFVLECPFKDTYIANSPRRERESFPLEQRAVCLLLVIKDLRSLRSGYHSYSATCCVCTCLQVLFMSPLWELGHKEPKGKYANGLATSRLGVISCHLSPIQVCHVFYHHPCNCGRIISACQKGKIFDYTVLENS